MMARYADGTIGMQLPVNMLVKSEREAE